MTYDFLSPEWFDAVAATDGPALAVDDPVVNLTITDTDFGVVKAHVGGTYIRAGHVANADASATLAVKYARGIFVDGNLVAAKNFNQLGCILGEIQVEGDYSMWAIITGPMNGLMADTRARLTPLTTQAARRFSSTKAAEHAAVAADIERLGLQRHAKQIDEDGYAVLTPEDTGVSPALMDEALAYIMDQVERETGHRPDDKTGESHRDVFYPVLWYSTLKSPAFQAMVANEQAMVLTHYMLGKDFFLSSDDVLMKGPSSRVDINNLQLGMHVDMTTYGYDGIEEPFPQEHMSVNALWLITDFDDVDDGVTVFVPGSQNFRRTPLGKDGHDNAVPICAPRGSFIIWPGTTWHGALPRNKPGLRVASTIQYCARYAHPRMPYQYDVTEEVLKANPPRFAQLMGLTDRSGWRDEGIEGRMLMRAQAGAQRYVSGPVSASIPVERVANLRKKPASFLEAAE